MTARIVLFGATGYTGRLTAEAMVRAGLRPVLAGRSTERLRPLARRLGDLEIATADVADDASVRRLITESDVLVSTVGPFVRLGESALSAAVEAGATYLDSTGEPPFIRRVFEEFGPLAERTGARLLTAFGHDYVPGNLAGALALRRAGDAAFRVDIGYYLTRTGRGQVFSRGTLASLAAVATEQGHTWRRGITAEPTGARMKEFPVDGQSRPGLSVGATEQYALPRLHPGLAEVDVYLGWFGRATRALQVGSRVSGELIRLPGARPILRKLGELVASGVRAEPDPAAARGVRTHFVAAVYAEDDTPLSEVRLVGGEPYRMTADLLAWGAGRAAGHGVSGPGALGPADAFGTEALEAGCRDAGLTEP